MCKRDLADRLDVDRKAIFGACSNEVRDKFRMSFPHRDKVAHMRSLEQLATARLRLQEDPIQTHAEDILGTSAVGCNEPEWYAEVICPSVKLWKAWNFIHQSSKYFTDRNAFLKLVAWAEQVDM